MNTDIVIAGGGLNGVALSLALAPAGFDVTLVEPRVPKANGSFDGRSYALALSSVRALNALGVWASLANKTQPIREIRISDGRVPEGPSPWVLEFDHAEIEEGPMGHMVEDCHLRQALIDAVAAEPKVAAHYGVSVVSHETQGARMSVTLSDGKVISASLLVAADGALSPIAARAGFRRIGWEYGQTALVCAISHQRPHDGVAHQYFTPPGPLAILPLPGNRASIVWTEARETANAINADDDAGYLKALRPRFGDFLGVIALDGARYTYPLALSLTDRLVAPRLALVGDAAHRVHPIAGQGLNAGLKDVSALAEVLTEARRRGEDIGAADVLARYQSWRRFDIAALAAATDGFNRLFSNDNPILRAGRDLGLGLVGALPRLRRGFIREAAGLSGDLPRLSRGLPL